MMRTWKTEMVRTCGEKDRGICSNENMEVGGRQKIGRQKLRWSDVIQKTQRRRKYREKKHKTGEY